MSVFALTFGDTTSKPPANIALADVLTLVVTALTVLRCALDLRRPLVQTKSRTITHTHIYTITHIHTHNAFLVAEEH